MIYKFHKQTDVTSSGFDAFGYPLGHRSAGSAGVIIRKMPKNGLIFHAPLSGAGNLTVTGTPQFVTKEGIPCACFDGSSYLSASVLQVPQGTEPRTLSCWFRVHNGTVRDYTAILATGRPGENEGFTLGLNGTRKLEVWGCGNDTTYSFIPDYEKFYHAAVTFAGTAEKLYINGALIQSKSHYDLNTIGKEVFIGSESGDTRLQGDVAAVRIYNRVLTEDEIQRLSQEFSI